MTIEQYIYDDGSVLGWDTSSGLVQSKEVGSNVWVDDPAPAPANWSIFGNDNIEQSRMGQGYPANGQSWDANAAMLGISRLIDTAAKSYATVKGSTPATFAGQNGQTYVNGQVRPAGPGGDLMPILLIGAAVMLLAG